MVTVVSIRLTRFYTLKFNRSGKDKQSKRSATPRKGAQGFLGFFFPTLYPQDRRVFTTLGRTAAVSGTRTNMKDLWTMYARPS
jgi:hypothetical protein